MEEMEKITTDPAVDPAAESSAVTTGKESVTKEQDNHPTEQEKKYTDSDVDKIVSRKINRERERLQKLFKEEQEVSELELRERNVSMRELKADARDELEKRGLPLRLVDVLDYTDRDTMEKGLDSLETSFKEAVAFGIKDALRGSTPRTGTMSYPTLEAEKALHNAFKPR